eukprot:CAMPEP_0182906350 /NCGR_PEP_ID=MMETSP0034_2-20130328/33665_1 /TAXON_ID=156128 /ORGANISM="Nephroselmis pyriformis, Strain CCMP717" /LENGTH=72 /DNA_ID=CAMNT_0025041997 /DNA_START=336 /DNA_END=551 /DNA_ORIENTATION=+
MKLLLLPRRIDVIAVSKLISGAISPPKFFPVSSKYTTFFPEQNTPSHAVPSHTKLLDAMFHVLTAACPAVSP